MEMAAVSLFVFFALFQPVLLQPIEDPICPRFNCGSLGELVFPYTNITENTECGLFVVNDCDKEHQQIQLERGSGKWYTVERIQFQNPPERSISIIDTELQKSLDSRNCASFNSLSLPHVPDVNIQIVPSQLITLLKCDPTAKVTSPLIKFNYTGCLNFNIFYTGITREVPIPPTSCSTIQLPANIDNGYEDIFKLLTADFTLQVTLSFEFYFCEQCHLQAGECHGNSTGKLQCLNANGSEIKINWEKEGPEPHKKKKEVDFNVKYRMVIGSAAASAVILMIIFCFFRREFTFDNVNFCWKKQTEESKSIEAFLRNGGPMAMERYKYTEVKKMTQSFKDKLGQGGYGGVFKGKLPDGRDVAVKILKESKGNGEEFINEVASISRTSHVNVVTLLGFCYEGCKRALIYEFMSNGSLEKYISKEKSSRANHELGWETLYEIAVGVARGLEYLHRGCNTRILHFDIKPHNILLDEEFRPKISDFGLAKICPGRESIVSMLGARGTVGYIAPEVFYRNFGGVSYKSDVYSYGMLVLEMVGARKNICLEVGNTSEIYFPDWIYKRIEINEDLGLCGIDNGEENQIARKLILVSLWCIQTNPTNRPPMGSVVEMMLGSVASLSVPPRPCWSSLSRSPPQLLANSSTTNEQSNSVLTCN
eukprot:XP_015579559.2 PR5-like receptor kinase [Ricinus communis]